MGPKHHLHPQSQAPLCGQYLGPQSMVTVSPYDVSSHEGLIGCDTDSSDSQYASVVNLPMSSVSPTCHKRPQQYYTTRLKPTRQLHQTNLQSQDQNQSQLPNRNPYVSPQLNKLTTTLRPYGYNAIDTYSNSSANSSPHRTALTNLSSSTTTVSTMQFTSPCHYYLNRHHNQCDPNSEGLILHQVPMTDSIPMSQESLNQHVYCEIPLTRSPRVPPSNFENLKWNDTCGSSNWHSLKCSQYKGSDEDNPVAFGDDSTCDLQNVNDLSEDELIQHHMKQHVRQDDTEPWLSSFNESLGLVHRQQVPLSETLGHEIPKKAKTRQAMKSSTHK
jgi:hypothetical protein